MKGLRFGTTFAAIVFALSLLFGCRNEYSTECKQIDSCITGLIKAKREIESISSFQIKGKQEEIDFNLRLIKNTLSKSSDTLVKNDSLMTEEYKELRKGFEIINNKRPVILKEINYCQDQLKNLKLDLITHSIPADSLKKYMNTEIQACSNALESEKIFFATLQNNFAILEKNNKLNVSILSADKNPNPLPE